MENCADARDDCADVLLDIQGESFVALPGFNLFCCVGGEFHDLGDFAVRIKDRVVGRPDVDDTTSLADPLVLGRLVFTAPKIVPELGVGRAASFGGRHKHAMVLSLDLYE